MRILGLDVGTKTVGVAMSDEMGWTAQGLETIRINEERGNFGFDRISELVKQYNVDKIVVGLPKNMNGTIGPRGEACQQFAENLAKSVTIRSCNVGRAFVDDGSGTSAHFS